jgi:acetyl-CoA synthetase
MGQDDSVSLQGNDNGTDTFPLNSFTDLHSYRKLYDTSLEQREAFWRSRAQLVQWEHGFDAVSRENLSTGDIAWFIGGRLNACSNALDVHIRDGGGDENALTYIKNDLNTQTYTYRTLHETVTRLAAVLLSHGLKAGDRVALYLPDVPESVMVMLACSRVGIISVPIPERFTPEIVNDIIRDCGASLLVVSLDSPSKSYLNRAKVLIDLLKTVTVISSGNSGMSGVSSLSELLTKTDGISGIDCASVDAEHPLFILYANSAAGIPRGSVLATGGFLVQVAASFNALFRSPEISTERGGIAVFTDLASAAGQCYGLWGALLAGFRIYLFESNDTVSVDILRQLLGEKPVPALLTTPNMLTALKHQHEEGVITDESGFPLVAVSGDVLTPRLVRFVEKSLTKRPERVINMWIQSESGAALITTYPYHDLSRPGALGLPYFGIEPQVINHLGIKSHPNESGQLVFCGSWPGMIRGIWGQPERFRELYFQRLPGYFNTYDGVRVDSDGFFWFMGRLDDVIKVRGQSLATSEIETVIITHPKVIESAVVYTNSEEGEEITAFLVVEKSPETTDTALESEISQTIERRIGEFAVPTRYVFTDELPRTRTGKIVRRILRRIATGTMTVDEDLSHVVNPHAVKKLIGD